jgi:valyl-tRNA synthetase
MPIDKSYSPKAIESKWYAVWENSKYFEPARHNQIAQNNYCIMIPPPNVTGTLHMGHAFQDTLMDTLIRLKRMQGNQTLWQVGTDHAGIATQMVVERQLMQQNISRISLGREKFVEKVWEWKQHSGDTICKQLRRLGASVAWSSERFTMDQDFSDAVKQVFITLYREDLIYRGKRLVNWDPTLHTAVSDLEVISVEEAGFLWHIKYPIYINTAASGNFLTIATTRPETMLGDTAVAVHPEDERYKHLIGQQIKLPLTNRLIPIIADSYVDPNFGTGCVKVTPAHDFNDYEIGKRHNLAQINIFTIEAKLNENCPQQYQGLDRFAARTIIVQDLEQLKLVDKIEAHTLKIPRGEKTNAIIEPYLTDQWYVKIAPLATPAMEAVKNGEIKFVPENWSKTYFAWMNNIQDWCISRQLWWGHRIPAWYDAQDNIYVGTDEQDIRKHYNLAANLVLRQETDVLDTWFSAALWPFVTLGWPQATQKLADFYPSNVLVTGFDIIFFWVARMIMFGLKLTKQIPFKEVYIHGLIQDQHGKKMSKTKGNVIDPLDVIDGISLAELINKRTYGLMQPHMAQKIATDTKKQFPSGISPHGTDALRFTFCALATHGRHICFDLSKVDGYRNFCNKIWNAARYVLMNTEDKSMSSNPEQKTYSLADKWIFSIWQRSKTNITESLEKYRFDFAAQAIYEFVWHEYCDWYLELSKPILTDTNVTEALLNGTRYTLLNILEEVLRVIHPIMPFISEEIWQTLAPLTQQTAKSLMQHSYPTTNKSLVNMQAEKSISLIKQFILAIRNIRGKMNIAPSKKITVLIENANLEEQAILNTNVIFLLKLAKLTSIKYITPTDIKPTSATAVINQMQILIPIEDLIDKKAELARLSREIEKITQELEKATARLANPDYLSKAPPIVVAKEQAKVTQLQQAQHKLQASLDELA